MFNFIFLSRKRLKSDTWLFCCLVNVLCLYLQIGYFLHMLLLRNQLREDDSFASIAAREMATLTGAMENGLLPLQEVINVTGLPRAPGRTPAWQASITWDEEGA